MKRSDTPGEPASPGTESSTKDDERSLRIMQGPAYVRADRDAALLERDELRSVRLQLEYLKPELTLHEREIRSVIVLFGGTRVVEPCAARERAGSARRALDAAPDDEALRDAVRVAENVVELSRYYDVAREFAELASRRCRDRHPADFFIMTGGGPGIMEAGNRGADDAGRESIGLNIGLDREQSPNPYITPELCFQFRYFAMRKLHFLKRARALVAFPGGYGTMDELMTALCLVQTGKIEPLPIIMVGESFWRAAFDPEFLAGQGVIADSDLELFRYADSAADVWRIIADHHGIACDGDDAEGSPSC